ncbi:MAG: hypothetical protein IKB27_02620 [Clostridia bacterium]|nr:hypothetical protein [Clostridia bacterium]
MTWFNKLPRLVQIIMLLIPGVNWVTELVVRWSSFAKRGGLFRFFVCLFVTVFGLVAGWIDVIWVLFTKHLLFQ